MTDPAGYSASIENKLAHLNVNRARKIDSYTSLNALSKDTLANDFTKPRESFQTLPQQ